MDIDKELGMQQNLGCGWNTSDLDVGGMLALFFGIAAVVISIAEPVFSARPFDITLLLFGVGCLFISWLALEVSVRRGAGR
jgi:hypothetical protein